MIKLEKPTAGWMNIQIGDETFPVSYLVDVWEELDYLFNLKDDEIVNRVQLDGESCGCLNLVAYLSNGDKVINIIWQENDDPSKLLHFDYNEFMAEYNNEKENIGLAYYVENFIMEKRYAPAHDVDYFLYDFRRLLKKYPDLSFEVREEVDYDYEENPYVSGYNVVVINYDTKEYRYIEEED